MRYAIYLASMLILLFGAVCSKVTLLYWTFSLSQLLNFFDIRGLLVMLTSCLLALFCTKSFRSFGRAFLFMFRKKSVVTKDSIYAVGTVMATAVIMGAVHPIISGINSCHSMSLTEVDALNPAIGILMSLISPFYALVLCMILLPVLVSVWKSVRTTTVIHPQKRTRKGNRP